MYKISVPKPCYESWNDMLPGAYGRFCNACAKTVIDFTQLPDEAVQQYLLDHVSEKVCGRFTNSQLNRITIHFPRHIFNIRLPFWKRFLVIVLLCFSNGFLPFSAVLGAEPSQTIIKTQGTPVMQPGKKTPETKKNKKHYHRKRRKTRKQPLTACHSMRPSVRFPAQQRLAVNQDNTALTGYIYVEKKKEITPAKISLTPPRTENKNKLRGNPGANH